MSSAVAEQEQHVSQPRPTVPANSEPLTMFDVYRFGLSALFLVGLAVCAAATWQGGKEYLFASECEAGLRAVQTASGLFGTGLGICVATALSWSVFEFIRRKCPAAG